ncbi:MAG: ankyrin repeat domain-containing protein [Acidobacteriota bacterium]
MRKDTVLLLLLAFFLGACSNSSTANKNSAAPQPSLEAKDIEGNSALLRAVNSGDTVEVRRLVEAGADVNTASNSGVTPLMNAAGMGNKEAVELLIQKGADVNHRTSGNYTPLMQAALVGQTEIVKILLDAGADPSVKDAGGRTAITYAQEQKHEDLAQLIKQTMSSQSAGKK